MHLIVKVLCQKFSVILLRLWLYQS